MQLCDQEEAPRSPGTHVIGGMAGSEFEHGITGLARRFLSVLPLGLLGGLGAGGTPLGSGASGGPVLSGGGGGGSIPVGGGRGTGEAGSGRLPVTGLLEARVDGGGLLLGGLLLLDLLLSLGLRVAV